MVHDTAHTLYAGQKEGWGTLFSRKEAGVYLLKSLKIYNLVTWKTLQYHYSFAGTIKNKSELKKLLKQLGI